MYGLAIGKICQKQKSFCFPLHKLKKRQKKKHIPWFTVTGNNRETSFPDESVNEQVTMVVPGGKMEPELGLHRTVTGYPLPSVATGSGHDTVAPFVPNWVSTEIAGSEDTTVGGVLSTDGCHNN